MRSETHVIRVGLLVLAAVTVLATGLFLIGERSQVFRSKNRYLVMLSSAEGLRPGNPVQISGVEVGRVESVVLPENADEPDLVVELAVDRRYASRVRADSKARLRTVGLLGDKYVEIQSGTPAEPEIPDGGEIPAPPQADLAELMGSGQDLMTSVTRISRQLTRLLDRIEKGQGALGALLKEPTTPGPPLADSLQSAMRSFQKVASDLEQGHGTLGRLLQDEETSARLASSVERLDRILAQAESGDGLLPTLLKDDAMRRRVETTLARLERSSAHLEALAADLEDGEGLLPKLLGDEEYGRKVSGDLERLLEKLNVAVEQATEGDGTLAQLIQDPHVYESLNDILVGINDSKILRWLIRNRQRKGIKHRLSEEPPPEGGGR